MKKEMLMGVLLVLNVQANAKSEVNWTLPEGKITAVFECSKQAKRTEIVRIYNSGQYEHLLYETKGGGSEYVERNLGVYSKKGIKIVFNTPTFKEFSGKFKYGMFYLSDGLYGKRLDARLKKEESILYASSDDPNNLKPLFIGLKSDVIVKNRESAEQVDFEALVNYLTEGVESDSAKVAMIEQFIARSIEYDIVGFQTEQYANDQYDIASILAGTNRIAVCSGYSYVLSYLCEIAGVEIHEVTGYTRGGVSELSKLNGYHVWNKILVDGQFELHDLTWADMGDYADGSWLNVRPEMLVLSHFPDCLQDQLLETPLSQAVFLNTACIVPFVKDVNLKNSPIAAQIFTVKDLKLTFQKDAKVIIYKTDGDAMFEPKSFESIGTIKERILFPVSDHKVSTEGDSSTYIIDLRSFLNVFYVEVDESYLIMFVGVRGTENDLLHYYAENADHEHYEKYLRGLLSAIKLKDYDRLRALAGNDNSLFFDNKGNFKMNRSFLETIEAWDGTMSELYVLDNMAMEEDESGSAVQKNWSSYYVEIPHGLKFTLDWVDGKYSVASIE
jgi:hypothetical protein